MDAGPIVAIFIMAGCGCLWGYLIAQRGRGVGWRVGFGIIGAVLWPLIGFSIDKPVYRWMRQMLGPGHDDWEGVLGVFVVAAIIVVVLGILITQFIPGGKVAPAGSYVVPTGSFVVKKPNGTISRMSQQEIVIAWNTGEIRRDSLVQRDGESDAVPVPIFLGIEKPESKTTA